MGITESSPAVMHGSIMVSSAQWDVDSAIVWLRGEHDLSTIAAFSGAVSQAIAYDDADLTLDLSEVLFMDAATVGVIVRTREFLRQRSRSLSLRSPSRSARRVLDLCGLTDLIGSTPLEDTWAAESAAALATWVAVPATDRSDQIHDVSSPKPTAAAERVRAVLDEAEQAVS